MSKIMTSEDKRYLTNLSIMAIICLTREPEGECRSPVPANFILNY